MTTTIIDEILKASKCFLCGNILSVPPIISISLEEEQYKCGRCKDVLCTSYTRITLFENMAKLMRVPCTYDKCAEKRPWGLVEQHERECQFRTIQCPIYQKCNDVVEAAKLKLHFKEKHNNNVKHCNEVWDLNVKFNYIFLIIVDNRKFLVYILHYNDPILIGILSIDPITKYKKYTVKLSTGDEGECSFVYENQNIIRFDERKHCYRCIRNSCQTKYHPYSQVNKKSDMNVNEFTRFRKKLITSVAREGQIKYTLNLITDEPQRKDEGKSEMGTDDEQTKHELLRKSVACPICEEYMIAPIFSCKTGHTICNVCKPRLKRCPTCQAELSNSRIFTLEELTENIKLTCQYEENGCKYTGNTERMRKHELNCTHKSNTT